jgi:hypothetical protein
MYIRNRQRIERYGEEKYYEMFDTVTNRIETPNNPQDDFKFWGSCCYLCRSVLAPDTDGRFGTAAYNNTVVSKAYKAHFVCFGCRRAWKPTERPAVHTDEHERMLIQNPKHSRCSLCGHQGTYAGLNCRVPPMRDRKGWSLLQQALQEIPRAFEAKCKCQPRQSQNTVLH